MNIYLTANDSEGSGCGVKSIATVYTVTTLYLKHLRMIMLNYSVKIFDKDTIS